MDTDLFIVCDFDDTLVFTRRAVEAAYREALGWDMPVHAWGKPWQEWCPAEVKARKDRVYPQYVDCHAQLTKLGELLDWSQIHLLTGASQSSIYTVMASMLRRYPRADFTNPRALGYSCSIETKRDILRSVPKKTGVGYVYIDDDSARGLAVTQTTNFALAIFDIEGGLWVIKEGKTEPWIPLSSRQELTKDLRESLLPSTSRSSL